MGSKKVIRRDLGITKIIIGMALVFIWGCATTKNEQGASLTPPSGQSLRYLAWLDGNFQTGYRADQKILKKRLRELEKQKVTPKDADSYLEYLSVIDTLGRKDSEKKIKGYLQNHSDNRAVFLLAAHYLKENRKELAKYLFGVLEKDAKFVWKSLLYNNLGMMELKAGERDLAIDYFERATRAKPPIAAPYVNLGALYLQSRSYKSAEKVFDVAVKIDPLFEDAALGLGLALEGLGRFNDSHKVYAQHIEKNPEALSVLYNNSIILGNRLNRRADASQQMLRYIQRGGKETAKAKTILRKWR